MIGKEIANVVSGTELGLFITGKGCINHRFSLRQEIQLHIWMIRYDLVLNDLEYIGHSGFLAYTTLLQKLFSIKSGVNLEHMDRSYTG